MRPLLPRDADLEVEHLPPPDKEQTAYNFDVAFLSGDGKDMSWIVRGMSGCRCQRTVAILICSDLQPCACADVLLSPGAPLA